MNSRRYYAFTVLQVVALCGLLRFIFTLPSPWDFWRTLGTAFILIGMSGIAVARYQLGRSFTVRAEAHKLITHGIYSKIRNPIYFFGTFLIAGFVLVVHQPIGWILLLVVIAIQIFRARHEANVLQAAFGDEYRDYRRKTWF
jgi:protein-S-isoprenylcysteine O-methyltransferase Ste14